MGDQLSADGPERFAAAAGGRVGDDKVPGPVALVARGDEVHVEALGALSIGGKAMRRVDSDRVDDRAGGFGAVLEMFMAAAPFPVVAATEEMHPCTLGPPAPAEQPDPDTCRGRLSAR